MNVLTSSQAARKAPSAPSSAKAAPADTSTAESPENKSVDKFAPLSNMTDDQAGWLGLAGLVAGTALVGYFTDGDPTMGFLKSLAVGASGGMITDFAHQCLEMSNIIPEDYQINPSDGWKLGLMTGAFAGFAGASPFLTGMASVALLRTLNQGIDTLRGKPAPGQREDNLGCMWVDGRLVYFERK